MPRPSNRHRGVDRIGRGCEKEQHLEREHGFYLLEVKAHFSFSPDWYRHGEVREPVKAYLYVLRSLLRNRPDLRGRGYLVRCRRCRIPFLTDPRNAGRKDLACPFGCREALRRLNSTQRSTAYYRTEQGRAKKKKLNQCRAFKRNAAPSIVAVKSPIEFAGMALKRAILTYLCAVVSLIERRRVGLEEIVSMLARIVRQRRIARQSRIEYILSRLNKGPP
jgi:hypothetical protein